MKITKAVSGKKRIKISKKEWKSIGKKAGWTKKASNFEDVMSENMERNGNDISAFLSWENFIACVQEVEPIIATKIAQLASDSTELWPAAYSVMGEAIKLLANEFVSWEELERQDLTDSPIQSNEHISSLNITEVLPEDAVTFKGTISINDDYEEEVSEPHPSLTTHERQF